VGDGFICGYWRCRYKSAGSAMRDVLGKHDISRSREVHKTQRYGYHC